MYPRGWPHGSGSDDRLALPSDPHARSPVPRGRPRRPPGRRRRAVAFTVLLAIGLCGLAVAAVGIAHQLLPRQFTAVQQREITGWEMARRWRVLSAGKIFPATVAYAVAANYLEATTSLPLRAQLLAISPETSCATALSATAAQVLDQLGCSTVLRATYVDASGSMVATIAVAVLPGTAAARTAITDLGGTARVAAGSGDVHALAIARSPAAGFADADRQLSSAMSAGPYVIMSTAGFADDRQQQPGASDHYLSNEMTSFAIGLVTSAQKVLGALPRTPVCPGAPGC